VLPEYRLDRDCIFVTVAGTEEDSMYAPAQFAWALQPSRRRRAAQQGKMNADNKTQGAGYNNHRAYRRPGHIATDKRTIQ
jgi:hypothetical protein